MSNPIPFGFDAPETARTTNHLCIHSSPPSTDPLPRMVASHQPLGTKWAHSPCLSLPELLPVPFFVFHGSPTRLTCMSTPPSPLILTGQHTSLYSPDLVPASSSKHSSPSPCPDSENQSGSGSPRRCKSWMSFSTASMSGPWWTNVCWVHVLMCLDHHLAYAKKKEKETLVNVVFSYQVLYFIWFQFIRWVQLLLMR
jgi:hypothetical protein